MQWIAVLLVFCVNAADDYYGVLGVSRDADEKSIKKAFKKISLELHPDRGRNTETEFMKISQVYEVLIDPIKREIYDTFGEPGIISPYNYNVELIYDNYFTTKKSRFIYPTEYFYENDQYVKEITPATSKNIHKRQDFWFVQFYGPRSKPCRELTGEWKALAKRLDGIVNVASVNCDENPELCIEFNIKKYPVIIFFTDNLDIDPELYIGAKTFKPLYDFILGKISWFLQPVTSLTFNDFIQHETSKIISFTNTKDNLPLVKVLAKLYKGRVLFGEAKASDSALVKKFSLQKFPCLVRIDKDSFEVLEKTDEESVKNWIEAKVPRIENRVLIKELNKSQFLAGNCNEKDTFYCFISVDPDISGKSMLNELAIKYEFEQIKFFWLLSAKYHDLANTLGKLSIIKGIKNEFITIDCDSFSCLSELIENTISGAQTLSPIPSISFKESFFDL